MSSYARKDQNDIENLHNVPRDPAQAGFVGKRRASMGWTANPLGNRGERRAAARLARGKKPRGL